MVRNEPSGVGEEANPNDIHPNPPNGCISGKNAGEDTPKGGKMSIYSDQIEMMVYEQKKILEKYTNERESCWEGNLSHCRNHGKETYYHTYFEERRYVRTSINQDPEAIRNLARKEYLSVAGKVLEHNISVLERAERSLLEGDLDYLKNKMQKAYRKLPDEFFFFNEAAQGGIYSVLGAEEGIKRHIDWAKEPYEKSTFNPEGLKHPTSAGFKVRSKSEQHIVEQLVNYGVPFRYEEVLRLNNKILVPDFKFRGRDWMPFYWEHAGMMNDPFYCGRHKHKMNLMEEFGIVPWKNMIITYDNDGEINVPMIKSIIEHDVIPRL